MFLHRDRGHILEISTSKETQYNTRIVIFPLLAFNEHWTRIFFARFFVCFYIKNITKRNVLHDNGNYDKDRS